MDLGASSTKAGKYFSTQNHAEDLDFCVNGKRYRHIIIFQTLIDKVNS